MSECNFENVLFKFSESLNEILITNSLTAKAVCDATGIPKQTFSSWTSQKYLASIPNLLILSDFFKLSIDYILNFSESVDFTTLKTQINFFETFQKLLKDNHKGVREFSEIVSIPTSSFTAWRHGNIPKTFSVIKIAIYFDCTVEFVLGRTNIK